MTKIDLSCYKLSKPYFRFFDTYLKTNEYNKEDLFYKLCINSSSYRRCRETEQKKKNHKTI